MNFESDNPFAAPQETTQATRPDLVRKKSSILTAAVLTACVIYATFTIMLLSAVTRDDRIGGWLFLCNWPALTLFASATWVRSKRAFIFGLTAIAGQIGIALLMFPLFDNVHPEGILGINGVVIAVFVSLALLIRWVHAPLYGESRSQI